MAPARIKALRFLSKATPDKFAELTGIHKLNLYGLERGLFEPIKMELGEKIRTIRQSQGISQSDVQEYCGLKREYLNRIIKGKIKPSVSLAIRIARALGVAVEQLFVLEEGE